MNFSGVARGTGWQRLVALLLGFLVHMRTKGLWIGLLAGALVQSVLLAIITIITDWKNEVEYTKVRCLK